MVIMCSETQEWSKLSYVEKNYQLFIKQKKLLDLFLQKGAISQQQYDKSLHDLTVKMCHSSNCPTIE